MERVSINKKLLIDLVKLTLEGTYSNVKAGVILNLIESVNKDAKDIQPPSVPQEVGLDPLEFEDEIAN